MSSTTKTIYVIGIGDDGHEGLTAAARRHLDQAEIVIGTPHTLALVEGEPSRHISVDGTIDVVVGHITKHADQQIVVLATGDPLFFGVARYLCERIGKERVEVVPNVSTMQLAFARVKESWDEAYLTNLATQHLETAIERMRTAEKVGVFTTEECPPQRVVQGLLDRRIDYFTAYVCENLGAPDERVTHAELEEIAGLEFSPLNVMVLVRKPNAPDRPVEMLGHRLFGNPDEAFLQSHPKRGLITNREVRVIALAEMDLGPTSIVWDIGAGSGSVAIEAAQLAAHGTVYAVEMDAEDHQHLITNADKFGVKNLIPVLGQAPEAWEELPAPDAIFVGGAGRAVGRIVTLALERLKPGGRLVANVGSAENLTAIHQTMCQVSDQVNVRMVQIALGNPQFDLLRFESLNPTFLLGMVKRS